LVKGCADGRQQNEIVSGDEIYISGADQELSIIKLPDRTFYTTMKEKMNLA
jgi:NAD+ kinase